MAKYKVFIPIWFIVLLVIIGLLGCTQNGQRTFTQMSPTERSVWMMGIYNSQFDDYLDQVIDPSIPYTQREQIKKDIIEGEGLSDQHVNPNLTEAQTELLRTKRRILIQLHPLMRLYVEYVRSGIAPTPDLENEIVNLINRLYAL